MNTNITFQELQNKAKENLSFSFSNPSELSPSDREKLYDEQARIVLDSPATYPLAFVTWAQKRVKSGVYGTGIEDYSVSEAVKDFTGEFANQAVKINESVNPFSGSNRNKILWIGAAILAAYILLPVVVKAIRKDE